MNLFSRFGRRLITSGLLVAAGLGGCGTGTITDTRNNAGSSGSGAGWGGGGSGGGLVGMPGDPRIPERVWRLTPNQINDEVRLMFGDGVPRFEVPPPAAESGITNVAANGVVDLGNANAFVDGARSIGGWVRDQRGNSLRCTDYGTDTCIDTFLGWFLPGAFRRPVTPQESADARTLFNDLRNMHGYDYAVAGTARAILLSPEFLYRSELGQGAGTMTGQEIANALAFAVTDRSPDSVLLDAGERGELLDPGQRELHARRLMGDSDRAWYRMFSEWLALHTLRSQGAEVGLSQQLVDQMDEETRAFLHEIVVSQRGTMRTLFTAPYSWIQPELAAHYGVAHPGQGLQRVELDPTQRAGLLTQGSWLLSHGKDGRDNVVRRGMNLFKEAMCNNNLAPPAGLDVNAALLELVGPDATVRETVEARGGSPTCGACHKRADPMGILFENYTSDGRWQTVYPDGMPVESAINVDGIGNVTSAAQLSAALVDDPAFQECFVRRATHYLVGIDLGSPEMAAWVQAGQTAFVDSDTSLEELLVALVRHPGFVERVKEVSP